MTINDVLIDGKLHNKSNVFHVYYLKKDNQIGYYKISFLNYDEKRIMNDMKNIEDSENFDKWLSLLDVKYLRNE